MTDCGAGVVDLGRVRAALRRLDELVRLHPRLTSDTTRRRLRRALEDATAHTPHETRDHREPLPGPADGLSNRPHNEVIR
jgi:hypothetical protein